MLLQIFIITAVFMVGSTGAGPRSDFDGNGEVDFADFVLFARAFESAEARFDLDGSGTVDFPDFVLFSSEFGKSMNAAKVGKTDEATQAELLRAAAKAYRESGNLPGAVEALKGLLALDLEPVDRAGGMRLLGTTYMEMGSLPLAISQFEGVVEAHRNSSDSQIRFHVMWANIKLGHIYITKHHHPKAVRHLRRMHTYLPSQ